MKKSLVLMLAVLALVSLVSGVAAADVTLVMGSWRADDVDAMNELFAAYEAASGVKIEFKPTNPTDYNATLRTQLEAGTAPDLMYARSYATGADLYKNGFFAKVNDLKGLDTAFSLDYLAPWTADGDVFAVPIQAVNAAVYYNKDIFAELGLEIPTTFEELLDVAQKLQDAGYVPFANGIADNWDVLECLFLGMVPSWIGGSDVRAQYENGEKPMNDEAWVKAYADLAKLAPFFPKGFESVTYNDSQALFATGKAAMFVDGSWNISVYDDADFDLGFIAIPAPAGMETRMQFHPDAAIAMNPATKYPEEARAFLEWLCSQDGTDTLAKYLPAGFFPYTLNKVELGDARAKEMLALGDGKENDARFVWPKMIDLYTPMLEACNGVLKGSMEPQAAADSVQAAWEALTAK